MLAECTEIESKKASSELFWSNFRFGPGGTGGPLPVTLRNLLLPFTFHLSHWSTAHVDIVFCRVSCTGGLSIFMHAAGQI